MSRPKKPKKKAIDKNLREWLEPHMKDVYRNWPQKGVARDRAKVRVQIGFYKNGNPEYKVKFRCYICEELFEKHEIQIDHVDPVIDPTEGFVDWNTFIERQFCSADNLKCACKPCHSSKSYLENELRRQVKNSKKDDDLY